MMTRIQALFRKSQCGQLLPMCQLQCYYFWLVTRADYLQSKILKIFSLLNYDGFIALCPYILSWINLKLDQSWLPFYPLITKVLDNLFMKKNFEWSFLRIVGFLQALEKYKLEQSLEHTSEFIEKLENELEEYYKHKARFTKEKESSPKA